MSGSLSLWPDYSPDLSQMFSCTDLTSVDADPSHTQLSEYFYAFSAL